MIGRGWSPLAALASVLLAMTLMETPSGAHGDPIAPSGTLLDSLLRFERSLNSTSFCFTRMKALWRDVAERKKQLDEIQDGVFNVLNQMATVEFSKPFIKECKPPFELVGGGCFYWPKEERFRKWVDARRACAKLGADLAYPNDISAFRSWVSRISSGFGFYYLGAMSDPELKFPRFRWLDGRRVFIHEKYRETPVSFGDGELCIAMSNNHRFKIKGRECDGFRTWYICEIKVVD